MYGSMWSSGQKRGVWREDDSSADGPGTLAGVGPIYHLLYISLIAVSSCLGCSIDTRGGTKNDNIWDNSGNESPDELW